MSFRVGWTESLVCTFWRTTSLEGWRTARRNKETQSIRQRRIFKPDAWEKEQKLRTEILLRFPHLLVAAGWDANVINKFRWPRKLRSTQLFFFLHPSHFLDTRFLGNCCTILLPVDWFRCCHRSKFFCSFCCLCSTIVVLTEPTEDTQRERWVCGVVNTR